MAGTDLVLDKDVRDWVLIPLTIFIILVKLAMQFVHQAQSSGQAGPSNKQLHELKEMQAVARSQRLRAAGNWLPEPAFRMRKEYFSDRDEGLFIQEPRTRPMHEAMATDPSFMTEMMKRNLTGVAPQIVMGTAVSFFFSGFVMGRVPFGLSPRFRPMVQRGVDLATLDVSYFTSLSYYIFLLFAARGPFSLFFREDTLDETEMMRRQMNPMGGQPGGFDAAAAFKAEKTAYEAADHDWALADAEDQALAALQQHASAAAA